MVYDTIFSGKVSFFGIICESCDIIGLLHFP